MLYNKNDKINNYTVVFPHKQGSYAETYRVKDATGKTRFLKLIDYTKLNRHQVDDEGNVVEIAISKLLKHQNLCKFIEERTLMVDGKQRIFFVTEFVSGETLAQQVAREGCMTVYDVKKIANAVLSALDFLHNLQTPVVHGEVTIQNIMLDLVSGYENLKLIDMGHSRFVNQKPAKPDLSELNPFYLAPERFSGVYNIQSDIYSVGVIMWYLLFGELPWFIDTSRVAGDKIDAILEERRKGLKVPQFDIFELDDQLLNTIMKALQYDAEKRFHSAQEFIQAINGEIKVGPQEFSKESSCELKGKRTSENSSHLSKRVDGPGFAAIAGMDELKQMMREEVIEPLNNPEEYKQYGISIPNGMLLYGPPGCGKTFFAKHFAEEVGFNFMEITPSTLRSRYINATQENIAKMFKEAEENAPTIIFIDEIDDLLKDRSIADDKGMSGINEFLAQMDRTGEKGIFIIGATNKPDILDSAIMRSGRFDKKYFIGNPNREARTALFKLHLESRPYDFGIDYETLADKTEGYVSADIQLIVNNAARVAIKARSKITMELLVNEIGRVRPSINKQELIKYQKLKLQIEGGKEPTSNTNNDRPRIGFF
ncbi:MAG: AAA family ATPase [Bacteroidaceae bacterium]|nr:AAA family ATPase [Bacteroidaceae bacterium]